MAEIEGVLRELLSDNLKKFKTMRIVAEGQGKETFSYKGISKRALGE